MASSLSYVEFVMEQLGGAGVITCRRMFGEYGLYCDGKYFACVCGDRLLVKITPAGEVFGSPAPSTAKKVISGTWTMAGALGR